MGNYGYAHVWELRSLKSIAEDSASVSKTPVSIRTSTDIPQCCDHAYRAMYESPGSQRNIGVLCDCQMYNDMETETPDTTQNHSFADVDILQQSDNRCSM